MMFSQEFVAIYLYQKPIRRNIHRTPLHRPDVTARHRKKQLLNKEGLAVVAHSSWSGPLAVLRLCSHRPRVLSASVICPGLLATSTESYADYSDRYPALSTL